MESEKSFNFNTTKIIHQIDKTPFYKLAFLTIGFGLVVSFGIVGANYALNKYDTMKTTQNITQTIKIEQIKNISEQEYNVFLNYLKANSNIYSESATLIMNALTNAEIEKWASSTSAKPINKNISEKLTNHKKDIENVINNINNFYAYVKSDKYKIDNINKEDLNTFIHYYSNFKAGVFVRNTELEKEFNQGLYNVKEYNSKYYIKHGIIERYQELDKAIDNSPKFK